MRCERRPAAIGFDSLVWNRTFDNQHERIELSLFRLIPILHEVVADLICKHGIVEMNLGKTRDCAEQNVFDTRLHCGCYRNCISVTTQPRGNPEDVNFFYGGRALCLASIRNVFSHRCLRGLTWKSVFELFPSG
jgi:hypothetical protein